MNDSGQAKKIDTWYTAAGVGCAAGGTCVVSPSVPLVPGPATWWIQWWGGTTGYGRWSDGMAFTVSQPSTMATLVSPSGATTDTTPTYTWQAVPGMTWYHLWIEHSSVARITQWMTVATAGCGSGTGLCSYTPGTALGSDTGTWWIQVWSPAGYGPLEQWAGVHGESVATAGGEAGESLGVRCDWGRRSRMFGGPNNWRHLPCQRPKESDKKSAHK